MSNTVNWMKASAALATFGFINLVLFMTLSNPFSLIMDTIDNQSEAYNINSSVGHFTEQWRMLFGLMFVLSFVGLIVWFLLGTHKEVYEEY